MSSQSKKRKSHQDAWNEKRRRLETYRDAHGGDCNVSQRSKDDLNTQKIEFLKKGRQWVEEHTKGASAVSSVSSKRCSSVSSRRIHRRQGCLLCAYPPWRRWVRLLHGMPGKRKNEKPSGNARKKSWKRESSQKIWKIEISQKSFGREPCRLEASASPGDGVLVARQDSHMGRVFLPIKGVQGRIWTLQYS